MVRLARKGLLIDYDFCTGCHTCEVACKQEHCRPPGEWGIKVTEYIIEAHGKVAIDYLPFPTALCDLCRARTGRGEPPACVKHCPAACMTYGEISELVREMEKNPRTVLFAPR